MKYEARQKHVDAVQWTGTDESRVAVIDFVGYVPARRVSPTENQLIIVTKYGESLLNKSDFIVRSDGEITIMPEIPFTKLFQLEKLEDTK